MFKFAHKEPPATRNAALLACASGMVAGTLALSLALSGCSAAGTAPTAQADEGGYDAPALRTVSLNSGAATGARGCLVDSSNASSGYIMASATSSSPLKFQMICGDMSYNYDRPNDGTATAFPLNMGSGAYTLRVMQRVEGNNYIQLFSTQVQVALNSELDPFLNPSVYCDFSENSQCVALARQLIEDANSQAAAAEAIYTWIVSNISYDSAKARQLTNVTGYTPNPDETLASRRGICFDYASLAAAMLRSVGIPTKIVTGYVADGSIYHAWNMVWLQGQWVNASFTVPAEEWTRIDVTFASSGPQIIGGKKDYVERFIY